MSAAEFGFHALIADRMQAEHETLAGRWFARLLEFVPVAEREVFPSETLLDHIPELILEISAYLHHPDDAAISANTAILEKATELATLRHAQRASLHQVIREYQLLDAILASFLLEELQDWTGVASPAETMVVAARIHQAVNVLQQATVEAFVALYMQTIEQQKERLEQFTRMAAHEWRQPLGALQVAVALLQTIGLEPERSTRAIDAAERSVQHLVELTHKLESIARMRHDADTPVVQEVSVTDIAREAARQLREMADARDVTMRVTDDLPVVTVDVGRLELLLVNLLSNAIKYSDREKSARIVEVKGSALGNGLVQIEVVDNGVGIPSGVIATVFQRFSRAHADHADLSHVGGVGLGLSIAEDCVRDMGGQIEVHSVERQGTTFVITLPMSSA